MTLFHSIVLNALCSSFAVCVEYSARQEVQKRQDLSLFPVMENDKIANDQEGPLKHTVI